MTKLLKRFPEIQENQRLSSPLSRHRDVCLSKHSAVFRTTHPDRSRTYNLPLRGRTLYPIELRVQTSNRGAGVICNFTDYKGNGWGSNRQTRHSAPINCK